MENSRPVRWSWRQKNRVSAPRFRDFSPKVWGEKRCQNAILKHYYIENEYGNGDGTIKAYFVWYRPYKGPHFRRILPLPSPPCWFCSWVRKQPWAERELHCCHPTKINYFQVTDTKRSDMIGRQGLTNSGGEKRGQRNLTKLKNNYFYKNKTWKRQIIENIQISCNKHKTSEIIINLILSIEIIMKFEF